MSQRMEKVQPALEAPECVNGRGPRGLRWDRLLDEFGCSEGCRGSIHKQMGLEGHPAHNDAGLASWLAGLAGL